MNLINETAALNCRCGTMLITLYDLSVGLDEGITANIRLVVRVREDILEVTRIILYMNIMGARTRDLFILRIDPCTLALLAISSDDAYVLTR